MHYQIFTIWKSQGFPTESLGLSSFSSSKRWRTQQRFPSHLSSSSLSATSLAALLLLFKTTASMLVILRSKLVWSLIWERHWERWVRIAFPWRWRTSIPLIITISQGLISLGWIPTKTWSTQHLWVCYPFLLIHSPLWLWRLWFVHVVGWEGATEWW